MLKLYHNPVSANSRRVWIALLEKNLKFELIEMQLDGDQYQPEFLKHNPFHHIPVLDDDGFVVIESLAILDYLEAKYPFPALVPTEDPQALAVVKMVELVTVNELLPATIPLMSKMMGFPNSDNREKLEQAKEKALTVLDFFEDVLGNNLYFGSQELTLADIVAGCTIIWLPQMDISLDDFPKLKAWCDRLSQRSSWQTTQPTPAAIEAIKTRMQALLAQREK
ncbi:MAG TPA: glutathione S-transferase family protein [Nostocaceae cyanobacterium]|nr:glutathione S-transferase family protein [Nostocaceae cyanobacterium]